MEHLTQREIQIADLIHQGYVEKEIASKLFLSTGTVHTYKKRIFVKLHARNIADVTRIFLVQLRPWLVTVLAVGLVIYLLSTEKGFDSILSSCYTHLKSILPW